MKRAFFVLGIECSGTRMLTQALIAAGCEGDAGHEQRFDDLDFSKATTDTIVFRRSFPHGGEWPNLSVIVDRMQESGFQVVPLMLHRKTDYVRASATKRHQETGTGCTVAEIYQRQWQAWQVAWRDVAFLGALLAHPVTVVPYEPFVELPVVQSGLFRSLGLPVPALELYNANEAYDLRGMVLRW